MTGKFDESISEVRVALALDPKSPDVHVMAGSVFLYAGKFDEAIQYYLAALEMNPDIAVAHANLGLAYVRKGMLDMGISEIKKAIEFFHDRGPAVKNDLAYAYVKAGRIQEAKDLFSELLEMRQKDNEPRPRAAAAIAGIYSNLGEIDKSLEWLEKAYEEHSGNLIFIYNDFTYDNLRSDPRFRALLEKIGFPNAD
jgi:pentatricopeptide repeat protein